MVHKTGTVIDKPAFKSKQVCIHHWLIEPAEGLSSKGVCKYCGVERMFQNILEEFKTKEEVDLLVESSEPLTSEEKD